MELLVIQEEIREKGLELGFSGISPFNSCLINYYRNGQDSIKFIQVGNEFFTNFEWDFGDGNFSNEYEPLHVYDTEGDYYVTLTGSDDFGCTNFYNALVNIYADVIYQYIVESWAGYKINIIENSIDLNLSKKFLKNK